MQKDGRSFQCERHPFNRIVLEYHADIRVTPGFRKLIVMLLADVRERQCEIVIASSYMLKLKAENASRLRRVSSPLCSPTSRAEWMDIFHEISFNAAYRVSRRNSP